MVNFQFEDLTLVFEHSHALGNNLTLYLGTQIKKAMNGTRYSYISTPVRQAIRLTFNNYNRPKIVEAIEFFKASAGKEVTFNSEDQVWKGKILENINQFVHSGRHNNPFTVTLEGIRFA